MSRLDSHGHFRDLSRNSDMTHFSTFVNHGRQSSRAGDVFDDAATSDGGDLSALPPLHRCSGVTKDDMALINEDAYHEDSERASRGRFLHDTLISPRSASQPPDVFRDSPLEELYRMSANTTRSAYNDAMRDIGASDSRNNRRSDDSGSTSTTRRLGRALNPRNWGRNIPSFRAPSCGPAASTVSLATTPDEVDQPNRLVESKAARVLGVNDDMISRLPAGTRKPKLERMGVLPTSSISVGAPIPAALPSAASSEGSNATLVGRPVSKEPIGFNIGASVGSFTELPRSQHRIPPTIRHNHQHPLRSSPVHPDMRPPVQQRPHHDDNATIEKISEEETDPENYLRGTLDSESDVSFADDEGEGYRIPRGPPTAQLMVTIPPVRRNPKIEIEQLDSAGNPIPGRLKTKQQMLSVDTAVADDACSVHGTLEMASPLRGDGEKEVGDRVDPMVNTIKYNARGTRAGGHLYSPSVYSQPTAQPRLPVTSADNSIFPSTTVTAPAASGNLGEGNSTIAHPKRTDSLPKGSPVWFAPSNKMRVDNSDAEYQTHTKAQLPEAAEKPFTPRVKLPGQQNRNQNGTNNVNSMPKNKHGGKRAPGQVKAVANAGNGQPLPKAVYNGPPSSGLTPQMAQHAIFNGGNNHTYSPALPGFASVGVPSPLYGRGGSGGRQQMGPNGPMNPPSFTISSPALPMPPPIQSPMPGFVPGRIHFPDRNGVFHVAEHELVTHFSVTNDHVQRTVDNLQYHMGDMGREIMGVVNARGNQAVNATGEMLGEIRAQLTDVNHDVGRVGGETAALAEKIAQLTKRVEQLEKLTEASRKESREGFQRLEQTVHNFMSTVAHGLQQQAQGHTAHAQNPASHTSTPPNFYSNLNTGMGHHSPYPSIHNGGGNAAFLSPYHGGHGHGHHYQTSAMTPASCGAQIALIPNHPNMMNPHSFSREIGSNVNSHNGTGNNHVTSPKIPSVTADSSAIRQTSVLNYMRNTQAQNMAAAAAAAAAAAEAAAATTNGQAHASGTGATAAGTETGVATELEHDGTLSEAHNVGAGPGPVISTNRGRAFSGAQAHGGRAGTGENSGVGTGVPHQASPAPPSSSHRFHGAAGAGGSRYDA